MKNKAILIVITLAAMAGLLTSAALWSREAQAAQTEVRLSVQGDNSNAGIPKPPNTGTVTIGGLELAYSDILPTVSLMLCGSIVVFLILKKKESKRG
jgi:hypothetical protein